MVVLGILRAWLSGSKKSGSFSSAFAAALQNNIDYYQAHSDAPFTDN